MSEARHAILAAIRAANGQRERTATECEVLAARLAQPPRHTRPAFDDDLAERLARRLENRAATVERFGASSQVPAAVMRYLARHELPGRIACAPALASLPWPERVLDLHFGTARRDETVSVTPCVAAVADSGVLVLASGPESPTTLNFVPDHHLVVVPLACIVRHIEDAWALLRRRGGDMPRAINVISGPSRTADIEQTIQLGAHGPRRLHVLLVAGE